MAPSRRIFLCALRWAGMFLDTSAKFRRNSGMSQVAEQSLAAAAGAAAGYAGGDEAALFREYQRKLGELKRKRAPPPPPPPPPLVAPADGAAAGIRLPVVPVGLVPMAPPLPVDTRLVPMAPRPPKQNEQHRRRWTEGEHAMALRGAAELGRNNYKEIAKLVGTRNATQVERRAVNSTGAFKACVAWSARVPEHLSANFEGSQWVPHRSRTTCKNTTGS